MMKTFSATPDDIGHDWHLVDAAGVPLGRLASRVAQLIRGKHKPSFTPHMDGGDFVIVVNAGNVHVTGKKLDEKFYARHSGYPGGFVKTILRDQLERHPERVIQSAVWGMLPHNRLGRQMLKKLKVYARPTHPHQAHRPKTLEI